MTIIVTGGAGFIGSALCRYLINQTDHNIVVLDKITYAANLKSLSAIRDNPRFKLLKIDLCDEDAATQAVLEANPAAVMHLAAESHVDRSIEGSDAFIQTNVIGTHNILKASRRHFEALDEQRRDKFRFLHVSTDEVFGALSSNGKFDEQTRYDPSSPYSASKAASDHLVSAWHRTYQLPTLTINCSNNYGPYQNLEKLIPLVITNSLKNQPLPVYGEGKQIRDWLFVEDHVRALLHVLKYGKVGETYCVGGDNEWCNIDLVKYICALIDEYDPQSTSRESLITFVKDRPGHDFRYAIDANKIKSIGWTPHTSFEAGLKQTVLWYADNREWWQ